MKKVPALCALLLTLTSADAALVEVSLERAKAYAENSIDDNRLPSKAIDGSGLTSDGSGGWYHDRVRQNAWHGKKTDDSHSFARWYAVDFGEKKMLDCFRIWNSMELPGRGVKDVEVFVSNAADIDFAALDFADGRWTSAGRKALKASPTKQTAENYAGELVNLDETQNARVVAFRIESVQATENANNQGCDYG